MHLQVRAGQLPCVVVANIGKGKDPDSNTYPVAEFGLNLLTGHEKYSQKVPDCVPQPCDSTTYFGNLRQSWDSYRNNRAQSGHEKQRKDPQVKKV